MRVDQAGEQPAFGGQLDSADRIVSPPVTVREQVDNIAAGQGNPADTQDTHQTTLTAATADKEAALGSFQTASTCMTRQFRCGSCQRERFSTTVKRVGSARTRKA